MSAILLPNSLFDDGSIECKNFWFVTTYGSFGCEWTTVQASLPYPEQVLKAIQAGEYHLNLKSLGLQCAGELVHELQWD